jgi:hypothetical protein
MQTDKRNVTAIDRWLEKKDVKLLTIGKAEHTLCENGGKQCSTRVDVVEIEKGAG